MMLLYLIEGCIVIFSDVDMDVMIYNGLCGWGWLFFVLDIGKSNERWLVVFKIDYLKVVMELRWEV